MPGPQIPDQEFEQRREIARAKAKEKGLEALVIWSRSGHTVEAYGDLYYLTNFHSLFPVVPDRVSWASRGHGALILPVEGDPVLITDYVDDPEDRIKVSDVRCVPDITVSTADVLREMDLLNKPIGLVGGMSFLMSAWRRMEARAGNDKIDFVPADDILERMRLIKSPAEIALMRHAAGVGVKWMEATMSAIVAGNTEGDAVGEGLRVLAANGGTQQDIAIASGPFASNYMGSSGIPHWNVTRPMEEGDLVHCDQWGPVDAYYTDFARSTVVGGKPSDAQRELLEGSKTLIHHIIDGIRPGETTFGDLYASGSKWLDDHGFANHKSSADESNAFSSMFPCFGHSLGLGIDAPWICEDDPTMVEENMTLAIEALVGRPGVGAANYEENIVVHADGVEILTASCEGQRWE
ncbi:Xaa-Pro peptidase family protein [Methyloligella sp. 2.7D]|uniref:M24 family metallopeptidase n=1 Tax=unclassified Methyloligella TaxID=2625955 RepID=UPI00157CA0DB|nr:Xaa-Pro peptidase family protein [Methyloligella sp. GL2]QKP77237.1 aminopeptidase P family protein [Methyloligella sp. GL2]